MSFSQFFRGQFAVARDAIVAAASLLIPTSASTSASTASTGQKRPRDAGDDESEYAQDARANRKRTRLNVEVDDRKRVREVLSDDEICQSVKRRNRRLVECKVLSRPQPKKSRLAIWTKHFVASIWRPKPRFLNDDVYIVVQGKLKSGRVLYFRVQEDGKVVEPTPAQGARPIAPLPQLIDGKLPQPCKRIVAAATPERINSIFIPGARLTRKAEIAIDDRPARRAAVRATLAAARMFKRARVDTAKDVSERPVPRDKYIDPRSPYLPVDFSSPSAGLTAMLLIEFPGWCKEAAIDLTSARPSHAFGTRSRSYEVRPSASVFPPEGLLLETYRNMLGHGQSPVVPSASALPSQCASEQMHVEENMGKEIRQDTKLNVNEASLCKEHKEEVGEEKEEVMSGDQAAEQEDAQAGAEIKGEVGEEKEEEVMSDDAAAEQEDSQAGAEIKEEVGKEKEEEVMSDDAAVEQEDAQAGAEIKEEVGEGNEEEEVMKDDQAAEQEDAQAGAEIKEEGEEVTLPVISEEVKMAPIPSTPVEPLREEKAGAQEVEEMRDEEEQEAGGDLTALAEPVTPFTPAFTQSTLSPSPLITPSESPATASFGWFARPRELMPVWEADSDEEGEQEETTYEIKAPIPGESAPPVLTAPTRPSWMQPSRFFHGALAPAAPVTEPVETIIAEEEPVGEAEPIAPIAQTSEPIEEVMAEEKPVVAEEELVVEAEPLAPTVPVPTVAPSWLQPARFFNVLAPVLPAVPSPMPSPVPSPVPSPQSSPDLVPSLVAPPMPISDPEPMPMPVFVPVSAPSPSPTPPSALPSPAPPSVSRPERVLFPQFTHARIPVMPKKEASAGDTLSFFDGFRETRQATEVADVEMDEMDKMDEMEVEPTHLSIYERPTIEFGAAAVDDDSDMEVEVEMPRSQIDAPLVPLQEFVPFAPAPSNANSWHFARPSGFGQFHSAPVVPAAQTFAPSSSVDGPMPVTDLFALLADQHEAEDGGQDTPMGAYSLSDDDDDMDGDDERSDGRRSDAPEPIEIANTTTGEVFTWSDEQAGVEEHSGDDDDMLLDLDDDYCPRYRARHGDGEDEDEMDPMDELVMMTRAAEVRPRRSKVHPAWKRMTEAQRDSLSDDEWDYLMGWSDEAPESLSRLLVENDDELADDEGEEEEVEEEEVVAGPSRHHGQRHSDDDDDDDVAGGLEGVVERLDQDGVVWMNGPLAPWESGVEGDIEAPAPEMSEADREMGFLAYQMEEFGHIDRVEQPFEASDIDPSLDAMFEVKAERAGKEVDIADVMATLHVEGSASGERAVSVAELSAIMGDMVVAGAGQEEEVEDDEIQIKQERISVVDEGEDRAARDTAVGTFDYDDSDDEDVPKHAEGSMAELGALLGGMAVAGAGQEEEEDDEIQIKQERISVVDEGEDRAARDAAVGTFDYTDSEDEEEDKEPARQFDRKGKGVDRNGGA